MEEKAKKSNVVMGIFIALVTLALVAFALSFLPM